MGIGIASAGWDATRASIAKAQKERAEMLKYNKVSEG
jgi:hypothetical protein